MVMNWGWAKRAAEERQVVETTALTEAFMEMDSTLSKAETMLVNYQNITGRTDLDADWDWVYAMCADATSTYMSLAGPEATPTVVSIQPGIDAIKAATNALEGFLDRHKSALYGAEGERQRRQAEAEKARRIAAQRQQEAAEAAARLAAELPRRAASALLSIGTRIQGIRNRLEKVPPARSQLLREFPATCSNDLHGCEDKAKEFLHRATQLLAQARASQANGDHAGALELARQIRIQLGEADELTDAVPDRLKMLLECKADPGKYAAKVRFKLKDAQRYAVDHHLVERFGTTLDFQLKRIVNLEASLMCAHPDYLAYQNGLDEVVDSIQAAVAKMRATS